MQIVKSEAPDLEYIATFDDFYAIYPRHEGKKDARKAWVQIPGSLHVEIIVSIAAWRPVLLHRAEGRVEFIKLPATWLRGECWTDELPKSAPASHAPAVRPEKTERTTMPEHVRDMIARLRGK